MTLGVLGTMVWDTIEHPSGDTVERWGGITYSLAAAAAAIPEGAAIRPIIRLGADLADRGWRFLESVPRLERPGGVVEVDEPNNRVHLRYRDRHHREEQLTGGVAGWTWEELAPLLDGLDALYVNLISGFELDREVAGRLGHGFDRPRYVDVHSLVLAVDPDGHRVPRRPDRSEAWLDAFHVIQVNQRELDILAGDDAPDAFAQRAVRRGARAVLVTRGPDGARWFARHDGPVWGRPGAGATGPEAGPADAVAASGAEGAGSPVRTGAVPLDTTGSTGDPTGCGDVWGATCFAALVHGRGLRSAIAAGNRAAARNVDHRGADGLYQHLRADS